MLTILALWDGIDRESYKRLQKMTRATLNLDLTASLIKQPHPKEQHRMYISSSNGKILCSKQEIPFSSLSMIFITRKRLSIKFNFWEIKKKKQFFSSGGSFRAKSPVSFYMEEAQTHPYFRSRALDTKCQDKYLSNRDKVLSSSYLIMKIGLTLHS